MTQQSGDMHTAHTLLGTTVKSANTSSLPPPITRLTKPFHDPTRTSATSLTILQKRFTPGTPIITLITLQVTTLPVPVIAISTRFINFSSGILSTTFFNRLVDFTTDRAGSWVERTVVLARYRMNVLVFMTVDVSLHRFASH